MAEVYLGTHQGIGGFRKLVVMKRLLGWQSGDDDAVEGLLDEARIAATINHPNVVSTLDIELEDGSPFIVLEYLSGENLLYVLQQLHAREATLPLGIACRIGASIAAALAQAHDLALPDGTRRCIVHRDVTPSNILVCFGGVTKLVDFGVARVADDARKTKAGFVKGKFSYLAPEQLTGAPLDGRTDVFQLGIVLWEMVTMRRLFDGRSDHERVHAILNRTIPAPSTLNPAVPPGLERTILRALERDPERRHQTAHELEAELLEALAALGGSFGDHSVGKWMQSTFADRYQWRLDLERRTIAAAAEADDEDELEVEIERDGSQRSHRGLGAPASASGRRTSSRNSVPAFAIDNPAPPPRRSRGWLVLATVLIAGGAVWTVQRTREAPEERAPEPTLAAAAPAPAPPADYEVDLRVRPAHATIAIDGVVVASGRYRASLADDGVVHTVTFTAPDHGTVHRRVRGPTTLEVSLEALTPPPAPKPEVAEEAEPVEARPRRQRERRRATATPAPAADKPAAATTPPPEAAPPAPPPPPKPTKKDVFAPSSDNLDPFAAGS